MAETTFQLKNWTNEFGREYTKRNAYSVDSLNKAYLDCFGISRAALNRSFLKSVAKSSRILEVGCNIGIQLRFLRQAGFNNLYAIEPQADAVKSVRRSLPDANIITGNGLDIPFKDGYFDLVYTSGVLIHIHPKDIKKAIREIYRCSNKYIWGFEYYAKKCEEVLYHGYRNLLWKTDFVKLFLDTFSDLTIEKIKHLKHRDNDNVDFMYLLKKKHR